MRKRITLPVDKIVSRPHRVPKSIPCMLYPSRFPTFQELYQQAKKNNDNQGKKHQKPYFSAQTSQKCSQSLKSSVRTPQNSNRSGKRQERMNDKLNRSVETKATRIGVIRKAVRSFSANKIFVEEQKIEKNKTNKVTTSDNVFKERQNKQKTYSENEEEDIFAQQYKSYLKCLDHQQHSHLRQTQCFLRIEDVFQLLKQMHYLRRVQDQKHLIRLWHELEGETYGGIPSQNLFQFLTYINHYNPQDKFVAQNHEPQHKKVIINSNLKIVVSQKSKLEIYEQYLALRVNRILRINLAEQTLEEAKKKIVSNIRIEEEPESEKRRKQEFQIQSFNGKKKSTQGELVPKRTVRLKASFKHKPDSFSDKNQLQKEKSQETVCYSQVSDTKQSGYILTSNESEKSQDSESNSQLKEKKAILSIDVNLGEGLSEKLIVYEGETALQVSNRLVEKYNIDESLRIKFQAMLASHIRNLLWRIDEVSEDMFTDREY